MIKGTEVHALPKITICAHGFEPRSVRSLLFLASFLCDPKPAYRKCLSQFPSNCSLTQDGGLSCYLPITPPPLTSQMLGQSGAPDPSGPGTGSALAAPSTTSAPLVFLGEKKKEKYTFSPRPLTSCHHPILFVILSLRAIKPCSTASPLPAHTCHW